MILGNNMLQMNLGLIPSDTVDYYRYVSRATNAVGQDVNTYQNPIPLTGSFQLLPRRLYAQYGLDFNKVYSVFYVSLDMIDIERDTSSDKIVYNGRSYQCESANDWIKLDGWMGMLCALFGNSS